jgi:hypothetical protein
MYEWLDRWIIEHPKTWCCLIVAFVQAAWFFAIWTVGNPWFVALAEAVIGTAAAVLLLVLIRHLRKPRRNRSRGSSGRASDTVRSAKTIRRGISQHRLIRRHPRLARERADRSADRVAAQTRARECRERSRVPHYRWSTRVGRTGLEPVTPCVSCKCATRLRQRPVDPHPTTGPIRPWAARPPHEGKPEGSSVQSGP